jgi:Holliday junction resolvase RusA-like endonuclease
VVLLTTKFQGFAKRSTFTSALSKTSMVAGCEAGVVEVAECDVAGCCWATLYKISGLRNNTKKNKKPRRKMLYTADAIIPATTDDGADILMLQVVGECVPQPRIHGHIIPRQGNRTIYYDPSQKKRAAWSEAVCTAIMAVGTTDFPIFMGFPCTLKLKVTVTFYINNLLKDVDNLLKFVLDGMQGTVYANNRDVYIVVTKNKAFTTAFEYVDIEVESK